MNCKQILTSYHDDACHLRELGKKVQFKLLILPDSAHYLLSATPIDNRLNAVNYRLDFKSFPEPVKDKDHAEIRMAFMQNDINKFYNMLTVDPRLLGAFNNLLQTIAEYYQRDYMFELLKEFS